MFGMVFVSICGVALPIVTGAWLAPARGDRAHATEVQRQVEAEATLTGQATRRQIRPIRMRPERFVSATPSAGFSGTLASGS